MPLYKDQTLKTLKEHPQMGYKYIQVKPVSTFISAEISDVALSQPLSRGSAGNLQGTIEVEVCILPRAEH